MLSYSLSQLRHSYRRNLAKFRNKRLQASNNHHVPASTDTGTIHGQHPNDGPCEPRTFVEYAQSEAFSVRTRFFINAGWSHISGSPVVDEVTQCLEKIKPSLINSDTGVSQDVSNTFSWLSLVFLCCFVCLARWMSLTVPWINSFDIGLLSCFRWQFVLGESELLSYYLVSTRS